MTTADWIPVMTERIVERFHPLQVILFGSQARGDAKPDSDVDLLVVLPEVKDHWGAVLAINDALREVPIATDVHVSTPDEIQRRGDLVGSILRPALREGRVLYSETELRRGMSGEERDRMVQGWLRFAKDDLKHAERAAADPETPARIVGFHAQQSAEKALKAILIYEQMEYPRTHNVVEIRRLLPEGWRTRTDTPDLSTLTKWAGDARYFLNVTEATPEEAQAALAQARAVWDAVRADFEARGVPIP